MPDNSAPPEDLTAHRVQEHRWSVIAIPRGIGPGEIELDIPTQRRKPVAETRVLPAGIEISSPRPRNLCGGDPAGLTSCWR